MTPSDEDPVRIAHQELRKVARSSRREAKRTEGKLSAAFTDAMRIIDAQKAEGVPFAERIKGLESVLRSVWPQTRVWHYNCSTCSDTGLVMTVCRAGARCDGVSTRIDGPGQRPGKYRRLCATDPSSSYEHDYGSPCWCEKGAKFRDKPKPSAEDFAAAGKSKPTRLGR